MSFLILGKYQTLKKSTSVTSYNVAMTFQIHTKFFTGELGITLNRDFIYTVLILLFY
jgi:hypothetical protein